MSDFRRPLNGGGVPLDPFGDLQETEQQGINRPPMHVEVTNSVRKLIVEGHLKPGEHINEYQLAELLNVSRTPLREALKALQGEGLVIHEPNKGSRVSQITAIQTAELFESLACVEGFSSAIATEKITARQLRRFTELHEEMFEFYHKGERPAYFALNERIHRAFVLLSGNTKLIGIHERLMVGATRIRFTAIRYDERWDESVSEHKEILAAMAAGDATLVRQLVEQHVRGTGACVCTHLSELETEVIRPRRPLAYQRRLRS